MRDIKKSLTLGWAGLGDGKLEFRLWGLSFLPGALKGFDLKSEGPLSSTSSSWENWAVPS